jgi:hypothetical protein
MSTAFHPQTDGITERANRSVAQIIRAMVGPTQTDWAELLSQVEFAINSTKSATTGYSPFELNYGYAPRVLAAFSVEETAPGIRDFAIKAQNNLIKAHDAIIAARVRQAHHANKSRRDHGNYEIGELVYLATENLSLPAKRARKLIPKYIGPFKISKVHNETSNVTLDLPELLKDRRVHPTFHVSRIKRFIASDESLFPNREPIEFYDLGQLDTVENKIDEIVVHV